MDEEQEIASLDELRQLGSGEAELEEKESAESRVEEVIESVNEEVKEDVNEESVETKSVVAEEEYTPSYTYKVLDEEKEFDDRFKELIKTKDDEDFIRYIVTRSERLDNYKQKYSAKEIELSDAFGKVNTLAQGFQTIKEKRDAKDYRGLLKTLGWEENDVLEFALELAEEKQLPDNERKTKETERILKEENDILRSRIISDEESAASDASDAEINELKSELSKPENYEVAMALHNNNTNIAEEVVAVGRYIYKTTGKYPAVSEVVSKVVDKYRPFLNGKAGENTDEVNDDLAQKQSQKQSLKRPKGQPVNAVNNPISSLDELKKLASAIQTR